LRHDVLSVDDDRGRPGRAERHVEHRPALRLVDPLAREHGIDARAQAALLGQPHEERKRLVGRAVLGVVEVEARGLGGHPLAEAWAVQAVDAADHGPRPGAGDALLLLSHRGTKRYTSTVLEAARDAGTETVVISGRGAPGADIETSDPERSSAFTASHLAALV